MQTITTIGLDIAKSVFQVYGVDPPHPTRRGRQSSISTAGPEALTVSAQGMRGVMWPEK